MHESCKLSQEMSGEEPPLERAVNKGSVCVLCRDLQRRTEKEERFKRHTALIKNNTPISHGQGQLQETDLMALLI